MRWKEVAITLAATQGCAAAAAAQWSSQWLRLCFDARQWLRLCFDASQWLRLEARPSR